MIRRLYTHRFLIARRTTQVGLLALFVLGLRTDWVLFGVEPLTGNLSASWLLATVPLADPFAVLQMLAAGQPLLSDVLLGAGLVLAFYWVVGGRAFCGWVCPLNMVTDGARRLRTALRLPQGLVLDRRLRYGVWAIALVLSALTGLAAFEWISPIGMLHREVIYGIGLGWLAVAGVFLFDLLLTRNGWCGHLCPLGATYALVGRFSLLRVHFAPERCTHCGRCHAVCPEPQVLNLRALADDPLVRSGQCTNCGNCIGACPEDSLAFGWRWRPLTPAQDLPVGSASAPPTHSPEAARDPAGVPRASA